MSGTVRAGLLFGLAALLAFVAGLFLPIPCVNVILAFGSVIALGWGAGYTAAKTTGAGPGQGTGRGLSAGAIGGGVLLVGTAVLFLLLTPLVSRLPGFQEALTQATQQNPEVGQLNPDDLTAALGIGFGVAGLGCGIVNFILMLLGGVIGGVMWKGTPAAGAYAAAGGSAYTTPPSGSYIPNQTNQPYGGQSYTDPNTEGGARVYDPEDPNRPR